MKSMRLLSVAAAAAVVSGVALFAEKEAPSSARMVDAGQKFVGSLSPELKKKASFGFDDPERLRWFFTPQQDKQKNYTRKGVRFEELSDDQKQAALDLLKSGTSKSGFEQAVTIMSLESILHDLEKTGAMVRNPGWYFVTIFGEPSKTGTWGWRIEGHHLSVNFTIDRGQISAATPFFFGANPAEVKGGAKDGLRTLPAVDDLARELAKSLQEDQRKDAWQGEKPFEEIQENKPAADRKLLGITMEKLSDGQRDTLLKLLKAYTDRMPPAIGELEYNAVKQAGRDQIHFAYTGTPDRGKPFTYRVYGPNFLVEFLNAQSDSAGNPANHIHSVWRHLPSDFGLKTS
jgi:hypothetical protein